MFNILMKLIVSIISGISAIVLSPVILLLKALNLVDLRIFDLFANLIENLFGIINRYVGFAADFLFLNPIVLEILSTFVLTLITFYIGISSYKLILLLYNKFKP